MKYNQPTKISQKVVLAQISHIPTIGRIYIANTMVRSEGTNAVEKAAAD